MAESLEKMTVLLVYFVSSTLTTVINKLIVSNYKFAMHYFLILVQSTLIVAVLVGHCALSGRRLDLRHTRKWVPAAVLLTVMIFTNMKSVYYFPVTLFTLYKNLSIVLVALLEQRFFNKKITTNAAVSFALMILSSYTVHITDSIALAGYFWMLANIVSTAGYMLYLRKAMLQRSSSRLESVFFTNLLGIPVLAGLSYLFDPAEPMAHDGLVWGLIALSALCALLTSFSTAWTLKAASSTALCMLGALNKAVLSVGGFTVFGERASLLKILSLAVGISAGALYSYDSVKGIGEIPPPVQANEV